MKKEVIQASIYIIDENDIEILKSFRGIVEAKIKLLEDFKEVNLNPTSAADLIRRMIEDKYSK